MSTDYQFHVPRNLDYDDIYVQPKAEVTRLRSLCIEARSAYNRAQAAKQEYESFVVYAANYVFVEREFRREHFVDKARAYARRAPLPRRLTSSEIEDKRKSVISWQLTQAEAKVRSEAKKEQKEWEKFEKKFELIQYLVTTSVGAVTAVIGFSIPLLYWFFRYE